MFPCSHVSTDGLAIIPTLALVPSTHTGPRGVLGLTWSTFPKHIVADLVHLIGGRSLLYAASQEHGIFLPRY